MKINYSWGLAVVLVLAVSPAVRAQEGDVPAVGDSGAVGPVSSKSVWWRKEKPPAENGRAIPTPAPLKQDVFNSLMERARLKAQRGELFTSIGWFRQHYFSAHSRKTPEGIQITYIQLETPSSGGFLETKIKYKFVIYPDGNMLASLGWEYQATGRTWWGWKRRWPDEPQVQKALEKEVNFWLKRLPSE